MLHKAIQNRWTRIVIAVLATFVYSVSVNCFIVPAGLYSSGILGLSQVLRTLLSRHVALPASVDISGMLYLAMNLPLLLLAWRSLGRGFLMRTLICTLSSSFFLSVIPSPATPIVDERLTSCVIGGIIAGFALGVVLTCGCSSGGLDVLGLWMAKKHGGFTVGRFSRTFNVFLYALCAVLFDIKTVIYSVIYMVFISLFVDRGHQQNITVQVLIFTHDEDPELPQNIMLRLGRGVTYWEGKGAYTGKDIRVLCVCVSKFEVAELRETVRELDPHAFFIVQEGVRIEGNFVRRIG